MDLYQVSAAKRWAEIRTAAGFRSDRALERAAELSAGTLWTWITPKPEQAREPNVRSLRILKQLLGRSLDELDEIFVSWRQELTELIKGEARQ